MSRKTILQWTMVGALLLSGAQNAHAHPGHAGHGDTMWSAAWQALHRQAPETVGPAKTLPTTQLAAADTAAPAPPAEKLTGQGALKFRLFAHSDRLPTEAGPVLVKAHGGFAVDRRAGKGETYFALPGAGIIQLSADLTSSTLIPTPAEVRDTNLHNTMIWYADDGTAYLAFPANDAHKVFTTSLDGQLLNTLDMPQNVTFDSPVVNAYFAEPKNAFIPTDVEYLNSTYFITTGYSALDYVLEAKVAPGAPLQTTWLGTAFGGKGTGPGQFGTGHGITVAPDRSTITISDRANSELDRFTPDGKYIDTVTMPEKSLPCDVAFESGYTVVGCLEGTDKTKGAPIFLLKDDKIVSTLMPKEDLGLELFTHIHNATALSIHGRLYVIAQAWNPGDFAIFEQVL